MKTAEAETGCHSGVKMGGSFVLRLLELEQVRQQNVGSDPNTICRKQLKLREDPGSDTPLALISHRVLNNG